MALVFAIMHLFKNIFIVSVHSFFVFFFNLVLINEMEWWMMPACPSLHALITGVILKRLTLQRFGCIFILLSILHRKKTVFVEGAFVGVVSLFSCVSSYW